MFAFYLDDGFLYRQPLPTLTFDTIDQMERWTGADWELVTSAEDRMHAVTFGSRVDDTVAAEWAVPDDATE